MPASTGNHCSRWTSQRGVMIESWGTVLVALASCRAATSLSANCGSWFTAMLNYSLVLKELGIRRFFVRSSANLCLGNIAARWNAMGQPDVAANDGTPTDRDAP